MAATRGSGTGGARKTAAGKRAASKRAATKRATGKRELLEPRAGDKRYVRRTAGGEFAANQDDVGRSLARDVKQRARARVAAGRGDEGDQKRRPSAKKAGAKKATTKSAAKKASAKKASAKKASAKKASTKRAAGRG
jgi:hypothetical protein